MPGYPVEQRKLDYILEDKARANGERVFLDFKGQLLVSFAELDRRANQVANGLMKMGVGKGDKVCVMLPNCPEYLYTWFGVAKAGGVLVPINTTYEGEMLEYIINDSEAKILVCSYQYLPRLGEIQGRLINLKKVVCVCGPGMPEIQLAGEGTKIPVKEFDIFYHESGARPVMNTRHSDPAMILYTSGTTGSSKGVVCSHHYCYFYGWIFQEFMGYQATDILYTCLPLFHVNALFASILCALLADARVALYEDFNVSTFWDEIRRSRATAFNGLGAMGNILFSQPETEKDSQNEVRIALLVPPPDHLEAFQKRFGLRVVYELYGMTECQVIPPSFPKDRVPGRVGRESPYHELRIVDSEDNEVGTNEIGELVVRPRYPYIMMTEYYRKPEKTLEVLRNLWFHTGDLFRRDQDGYYYLVDRKKEAIVRKGKYVSSLEIEQVINRHPEVVESVAVSVRRDAGEDEEIKVIIVPKAGASIEPQEIIAFCRERLDDIQIPRFVEIRAGLPKTATGKPEKYRLKEEGITGLTWDRFAGG